MTDNDTSLSGEARLKAKRNAFFRYFGLALLAGFIVGMISGVAAAMVEYGSLPKSVLIGLWTGSMVLFATAANVPCIVVQRYNRARVLRLAAQRR